MCKNRAVKLMGSPQQGEMYKKWQGHFENTCVYCEPLRNRAIIYMLLSLRYHLVFISTWLECCFPSEAPEATDILPVNKTLQTPALGLLPYTPDEDCHEVMKAVFNL